MTHIIDTRSKRRLSAMVTTGIVLSAIFAFGSLAVSASADNDWRGRGHGRGYNNNWNGGYYRAPPVVYGSRMAHRTTARRTMRRRWSTVPHRDSTSISGRDRTTSKQQRPAAMPAVLLYDLPRQACTANLAVTSHLVPAPRAGMPEGAPP
jgi:hypothetical protein